MKINRQNFLRQFFTGSLIIMFNASFSQPILNALDINPIVGESYKQYYNNFITLSPGSGGANITWDFSSITGNFELFSNIYPSSVLWGYGSNFPQSNVARSKGSGYTQQALYYKADLTALSYYGWSVSTTPSGSASYSNPKDELRFPLSYNDSYTDTFSAGYFYNYAYHYLNGTITVTADAWGTLITPAGTFTDVMRVHKLELIKDSVVNQSGSIYLDIDSISRYYWYKNGAHVILASIQIPTVTTPDKTVTYTSDFQLLTDATDSFVEKKRAPLNIYPNPSGGLIKIKIASDKLLKIEFSIYNMNSEKVYESIIGKDQSVSEINLSFFPKGIYFAKMFDGEKWYVEKIILE